MKVIALATAVALITPVGFALAQSGDMKGMDMKGMEMKSMPAEKKAQAKVHKATGVVKEVDPAKGTVTLAHEPVKDLKWPAMTMTYGVKDKALLEKAQPGAKVEFSFVQSGKDYVITEIKK